MLRHAAAIPYIVAKYVCDDEAMLAFAHILRTALHNNIAKTTRRVFRLTLLPVRAIPLLGTRMARHHEFRKPDGYFVRRIYGFSTLS